MVAWSPRFVNSCLKLFSLNELIVSSAFVSPNYLGPQNGPGAPTYKKPQQGMYTGGLNAFILGIFFLLETKIMSAPQQ